MWQQIIVGLIVAAALYYVVTKYLPVPWRKKKSSGCGSSDDGCGSCGSCDTGSSGGGDSAPPSDGPMRRVITLHVQR